MDKRADGRLLRITLEWRHRSDGRPQDEPWMASIFRTADGARVALAGGLEGTVEDVVDDVVQTFVTQTRPAE